MILVNSKTSFCLKKRSFYSKLITEEFNNHNKSHNDKQYKCNCCCDCNHETIHEVSSKIGTENISVKQSKRIESKTNNSKNELDKNFNVEKSAIIRKNEEKLIDQKHQLEKEYEEKINTEKKLLKYQYDEQLKQERLQMKANYQEKMKQERISFEREYQEILRKDKIALKNEFQNYVNSLSSEYDGKLEKQRAENVNQAKMDFNLIAKSSMYEEMHASIMEKISEESGSVEEKVNRDILVSEKEYQETIEKEELVFKQEYGIFLNSLKIEMDQKLQEEIKRLKLEYEEKKKLEIGVFNREYKEIIQKEESTFNKEHESFLSSLKKNNEQKIMQEKARLSAENDQKIKQETTRLQIEYDSRLRQEIAFYDDKYREVVVNQEVILKKEFEEKKGEIDETSVIETKALISEIDKLNFKSKNETKSESSELKIHDSNCCCGKGCQTPLSNRHGINRAKVKSIREKRLNLSRSALVQSSLDSNKEYDSCKRNDSNTKIFDFKVKMNNENEVKRLTSRKVYSARLSQPSERTVHDCVSINKINLANTNKKTIRNLTSERYFGTASSYREGRISTRKSQIDHLIEQSKVLSGEIKNQARVGVREFLVGFNSVNFS